MSVNVKIYNKIGYGDVYPGMVLRIVTEGPGIKSDVEGTVQSMFRGDKWLGETSSVLADYDRVAFSNDPATSHIAKYPEYSKGTTVELYEVIDATPDEPKGVGAVVRVVNLTYPDRVMEAVKIGQEGLWVWEGTDCVLMWESISECVLSQGYDYIKVLSEGVEL